MNKKKLIPIIVAALLLIVAIFLFISNNAKKNESYSKLIINYNNDIKEYTNLADVPFIMINDNKFTLASVGQKVVILYTSKEVAVNGKAENDIEIHGGKEYKICFETNNCFLATYTR